MGSIEIAFFIVSQWKTLQGWYRTQDYLFRMQSTCSKGAVRRNRCSFVKVGPTESRNTFGNEVNAQFLATILPMHSVGFHGGPSTLRPGGTFHTQSCHHGNDTKNQLVDVAHNFLFRVQIKDKHGHNSTNKNTRAWITVCLHKRHKWWQKWRLDIQLFKKKN